jgi:hypothetical protein
MRNAYRILVGNFEGKKLLERPRHRYKDNIKVELKTVSFKDVEWIHVAHDLVQWLVLVNGNQLSGGESPV